MVATNALELGIDIGELDAVICAGYPGSVGGDVAALRTRRATRGAESICVLVASSAPRRPVPRPRPAISCSGAPVEEARIDPDNVGDPGAAPEVRRLRAALPARRVVRLARARRDGRRARRSSRATAVLHESGGTFHWAADAYPANDVSLRSVGWDNVVIIDVERDSVDRRARLARRPHDAARAGHLPARRRVLAGRALRLREPQGVRAPGRARLLHRRRSRTCRCRVIEETAAADAAARSA